MDAGPIPFSSIVRYANEFTLKGAEREALMRVIRALDNRYLNILSDKRKKEREKASKPTTGGTVIDSW